MIEADGMADFVGECVAQIVSVETASEADLPRLQRIETDQRALDAAYPPIAGPIGDIGKRTSSRLALGADHDASGGRVFGLPKRDVECRFPQVERGPQLGHERGTLDGRTLQQIVDRLKDPLQFRAPVNAAGSLTTA